MKKTFTPKTNDPARLETMIKKFNKKTGNKVDSSKIWKDIPGMPGFQIHYLGVKYRHVSKKKVFYRGSWKNGAYLYTNQKIKHDLYGEQHWSFAALQQMANGTYDPNKEAHHNNKITFHNYIENIATVTKAEHAKIHSKMRDLEAIEAHKKESEPMTDAQMNFIIKLVQKKDLSKKEASNVIKKILDYSK